MIQNKLSDSSIKLMAIKFYTNVIKPLEAQMMIKRTQINSNEI